MSASKMERKRVLSRKYKSEDKMNNGAILKLTTNGKLTSPRKTSIAIPSTSQQMQYSSANRELMFKLMILGDSGVGKTCVLLKFRDNAFLSGTYISTVGIDFRNKIVDVDGTKVKLQIWDTAGQERFRSVTHAYYRDAHALLLLYDVSNRISFENIRAWLVEIKEYAQDDVVIMLLGNKADCKSSERAIRKEDGEKLAKEYSVAFMETSAKTGQNVDVVFMAIARQLLSKQTDEPEKSSFNVQDYIKEHTEHTKCSSCNM